MSRDPGKLRDQGVLCHYVREPLIISNHPAKFGGHRHSDSEHIIFLICHTISQDHETQEPCDFLDRSTLS